MIPCKLAKSDHMEASLIRIRAQCLICDTTIGKGGDPDVGVMNVEVQSPTKSHGPSDPTTPSVATSPSASDHIGSLCKLLGLSVSCSDRLKNDAPDGTMFCSGCTRNLGSAFKILEQILELQEKLDRLKVLVDSQIKQSYNRDRPRPVNTWMETLRGIIVQDINVQSFPLRLGPGLGEVGSDTGNDPLHHPLVDDERDQSSLTSQPSTCIAARKPSTRTRQEPKLRLGMRDCTVDLSRVKAELIETDASTQPMSRFCGLRKKNSVEAKKKGRRKTQCTLSEVKSDTKDSSLLEKKSLPKVPKVRRHKPIGKGQITTKFACSECPASFKRQELLGYHRAKNHELTEFTEICSNCGKRFVKTSALITHVKVQGGTCKKAPLPPDVSVIREAGPYQFKCEICGLKVVSRTRLNNHMVSHTKVKRYTCDICGKSFGTNMSLKSHRLGLHPDAVPESDHPHKCTYEGCGRTFGTAAYLRVHTKTVHLNQFDFQCGSCGFQASTQTLLRIHVELEHLGLRKYECKVCGVALRRNGLKKHMLAFHTAPEDRPFKCGVCGKTFSDKFNLGRHEIIHTNLKPIRCEICDKRFAVSDYLRIHMRTHTGEPRTKSKASVPKKQKSLWETKTELTLETTEITVDLNTDADGGEGADPETIELVVYGPP